MVLLDSDEENKAHIEKIAVLIWQKEGHIHIFLCKNKQNMQKNKIKCVYLTRPPLNRAPPVFLVCNPLAWLFQGH